MPRYKPLSKVSKRTLRRRFTPQINNQVLTNENLQEHNEDILPRPEDIIESDRESVTSDKSITDDLPNEFEDYKTFLIEWKLSNNITSNATSELLKFLNKNGHPDLPKDCRTLMQTPKQRLIIDIPPGKYVHISLKNSLETILTHHNDPDLNEIIIDFNVDGVPISKSTNSSFWPILFRVRNIPTASVSCLGVYHGLNKPRIFADFLRPHINELKELITHFSFNNKIIKVLVGAYICDAPAKALISGIKGHSGRFGCSKCCQEGVFINSRMTFPELDAMPRTDVSFRERIDENHHKFSSPLEELEIDMVKQIPLDYLHVVLLGVVKKLIRMWISGDLPNRLPSIAITQISQKLLTMLETQPKEFQRKIRSLQEFGYFKGSELRTFLLYSGPVALKDILDPEKYHHFLMLHIAITIFCDKHMHITHLELARKLILSFVETMANLYGDEHIVYNVHSLCHIADDVETCGSLDDYSSFPFESYMYQIKRLLHKNCQPLPEIANRLFEMNNFAFTKKKKIINIDYPILKKEKTNNNTTIFNEIIFKDFVLNNKINNQWILTKTNIIVKFKFAKRIRNEIAIYVDKIKKTYDFYDVPVKSSAINIYASSGELEGIDIRLNIDDIYMKMFCINNLDDHNMVFFPLLHTN